MNPSAVETDVQSGQVAMRQIISFKHSATCEWVLPISTRYVQAQLLLKKYNWLSIKSSLHFWKRGTDNIALFSCVWTPVEGFLASCGTITNYNMFRLVISSHNYDLNGWKLSHNLYLLFHNWQFFLNNH